jgi:type IV pilus assembly protein PilC
MSKQLSGKELSSLSRQLALVIDSDLSLQEGMELVSAQTQSAAVQQLLSRVTARLNEGQTLADSFAQEERCLPKFYIEMIRMGEQSGNMEKVLNRLADSYDKDAEVSGKVISAVTYPIILSVLMLCVIVLLIVEVLPMFEEVLASLGGQMPGITRALLDIGRFIGDYFYILLGIIALLVIAVIVLRQTPRGKEMLDGWALKAPVRGRIQRDIACVRFARSLSMLLRSGIGVAESVQMVAATMTNTYMRVRLSKAATDIQKGKPLGEAIIPLGLFPELLLRMLAVGESTGHTDNVLDKAADVMEQRLDERLARLTTVLEPALIIVLSLIVGVVLVSVILPVARIMNAVG